MEVAMEVEMEVEGEVEGEVEKKVETVQAVVEAACQIRKVVVAATLMEAWAQAAAVGRKAVG